MALEYTGMIVGEKNSALIVAPQSAYVIAAQCVHGCTPAFYVAADLWSDDVDDATIYRTIDAGEAAREAARRFAPACLQERGAIFDIKPLAGYVSPVINGS
jgi:hypothetical protein